MFVPSRELLRDPYRMLPHLERLVLESMEQRRRGLVPPLHETAVRYRREPPGVEEWLTALETFQRGFGDCEDLAVWRCADLRLVGVPAKMVIKLVAPGKFHALVSSGGGRLHDPSRVRGMRGSS